jgi:hypothetical protein
MDSETAKKIAHVLNIQGDLFQQRCVKTFKDVGFTVIDVEHPVAFPKPAFGQMGKDVNIDIWAKLAAGSLEIHFLVECKKADPKLKSWLFYSYENQVSGTAILDFSQSSGEAWKVDTFVFDIKPKLGFQSEPLCFYGREVKGKFESALQKDDTKSSSERISSACLQATQAANGIYSELGEYYDKISRPGQVTPVKAPCRKWVLPLVVTTADLFIVEIETGAISAANGEVQPDQISERNFKQRDFVLYNYPVPGFIRFAMAEENIAKMSLEQRGGYKKVLLPIVNASHLPAFLANIKQIVTHARADLTVP